MKRPSLKACQSRGDGPLDLVENVGNFVRSLLVGNSGLESVQDFLIKSDIKPCMHLVEIIIFSLNLVIVRPTKIMNRADKNWAQF